MGASAGCRYRALVTGERPKGPPLSMHFRMD
jgi:hypothetical protein